MSRFALSRPLAVLAASSLGLLVVGAGGAIGLGTAARSRPPHAAAARDAGAAAQPGSVNPGGPLIPAPPAEASPAGAGPSSTVGPGPASGAAGKGSSTSNPSDGSGVGGAAPVGGGPTTVTTGAGATTSPARLSPSPSPSTEPADGTYNYATQGGYSVFDHNGAYPPTTSIVVAASGCGQSEQWNTGRGATTTIVGCPVPGGIHVVSETDQTSYDGHTASETFTCDADSFVPTSGTAGQVWRWDCHTTNGETSAQVVTLDGPETLEVAGAAVDTEHVSIDSTLSGPVTGRSDVEDWFDPVGLRVKETGAVTASEYGIQFTSDYTLDLDSLRPS